MYDIGHELTCEATGYDPTYLWTGSASLDPAVSSSLNPYPLVEGPFDLTCTATVSEVPCDDDQTISGTGKCQKQHSTLVAIFALITTSVG